MLISVKTGEEVLESLTRQLKELDIRAGALVSIVGAVNACALSNMSQDDAMVDHVTELVQPLELSGTGEIKEGIPHIHVVVSGEGNIATAGHLHWATVKEFFVNIYVVPMDSTRL
ncbi:MAG TPA: DUF296 domain-containing protein [Propionibacteriaceae bacterium]|nr:DUF296 domain-containing protein [Propionibacteriaceae bacterium]